MARANEQWGDHGDSQWHERVTGLMYMLGMLLLQEQEPCPKAALTTQGRPLYPGHPGGHSSSPKG